MRDHRFYLLLTALSLQAAENITPPASIPVVAAAAGLLLQVRVEQDRQPVAVRWLDPQGAVIVEAQNDTLDAHAAIFSVITSAAGEYRVEIRLAPKAKTVLAFRVEVAPPRLATDADNPVIAGERLYYEGIALLAKPGAAYARKAIEKFNEAAKSWKDSPRATSAMYQLSEAYFFAGDVRRSLESSTAALAAFRKSNDTLGIVMSLNNQGVAYNNLGESRRAIDCYTEGLPYARQLADPFHYGNLLNSLGRAHSNLTDNDTAIRYLNQSLDLWRASKELRWQGITLNNLGLAYRANGELERAREMFKQAIEFRKSSGDLSGEAVSTTNLGLVDVQEGDLPTALERFERALTLTKQIGNPRTIAAAQHQIGSVELLTGKFPQAERHFSAALEGRRATGDRLGEASTLLMLAKTHYRRGTPAQAVEPLDQALTISRQIGAKLEEATILSTIARVRGALGEPQQAINFAEASVQVHEAIRGGITDPQSRTRYLATVRDQYDDMTTLLMELKDTAKALEASERAHARGLLDLLEEARVDIREGVDASILAKEKQLQAKLTTLSNTGAAPDAELGETLRQLGDTQAEIRRQSPAAAALGQAPLLSAAAIQKELLDKDTALLEYSLGDERSFAWLVTGTSVTAFNLPPRREIERLARAAYAALSVSLSSDDAAITALSRVILWPLAPAIVQSRLAIVADGALLPIPFGALPLPVTLEPLATRMETVYLPSAAALASLRSMAASRPAARRIAAIIADPVFRSDDARVKTPRPADNPRFDRLPSTRAEAMALAALLPGADLRMDFDARREFFSDAALSQYRILHLATHSVLNGRQPELSGVALSLVDRQGRAQNGFLSLHEVSRLKLGADLVVLSACETALGRQMRGEGLLGLARAFLFAGSPRVLASLWQVPDQATAELMKRFYTAMIVKKMRPAEALRAAQAEIRAQRRWARPYYWAGFVLQGDWR